MVNNGELNKSKFVLVTTSLLKVEIILKRRKSITKLGALKKQFVSMLKSFVILTNRN